ncbi:hypothetical protein OG226_31685 [Streptomyces sp. NBC_01261]|uniref:hypothetical protein n=1 Tax=unclassified Streptomyces TaxID=2593676 RepID=UPI002E2B3767|nr:MULTISPECIES: hypothetical protein [unclassified Streptomyces]
MPQSGTPVLIAAIAVPAPRPAHTIGRRLPVPPVISEILPGNLAGTDLLGWAGDGQVIDTLSGTEGAVPDAEGAVRGSGSW